MGSGKGTDTKRGKPKGLSSMQRGIKEYARSKPALCNSSVNLKWDIQCRCQSLKFVFKCLKGYTSTPEHPNSEQSTPYLYLIGKLPRIRSQIWARVILLTKDTHKYVMEAHRAVRKQLFFRQATRSSLLGTALDRLVFNIYKRECVPKTCLCCPACFTDLIKAIISPYKHALIRILRPSQLWKHCNS